MQSIRDHRLQTEICAEMTETQGKYLAGLLKSLGLGGNFITKELLRIPPMLETTKISLSIDILLPIKEW